MKKQELKERLLRERVHRNDLKLKYEVLIEEHNDIKKELKRLKSMNLTEFYKTINSENKKTLWFDRMDGLISEVIDMVNELK